MLCRRKPQCRIASLDHSLSFGEERRLTMRSLSPMSRKMVIHSLVEQESSLPKWLQIGKVSPINYIQMLSRQVHARHKSCKIWLSGMRNFFPQMICLMSTVNCIHFGSNHHFTYTADVSLTSKFRSPALIGKQIEAFLWQRRLRRGQNRVGEKTVHHLLGQTSLARFW